jgi:hypothetical protein
MTVTAEYRPARWANENAIVFLQEEIRNSDSPDAFLPHCGKVAQFVPKLQGIEIFKKYLQPSGQPLITSALPHILRANRLNPGRRVGRCAVSGTTVFENRGIPVWIRL